MKILRSRMILLCLLVAASMLIQTPAASAFGLKDLSSAADTAKGAAEGASLLDRAKSVYTGFYDSTDNLIDAQTTVMSLIDPEEGASLISKFGNMDSGSGLSTLSKMVGFSESMDAATTSPSLTSKLTKIITTPGSMEKAKKVYDHASTAYTSGNSSVSEAKTLYTEIKNFIASPSAKGLSESLLSGLGEYSDKILPFIIENGPERVQSAAKIAEMFKGFL
ncbi:hypothetical protein [Desulfovibrio sp. JC010]|uniref:hypothetical protein n=1 Tax=Desulfovibrio sp. JC010 TaxID=2593641 RepID=UPI0013CF9001|nr:hypothetical protein [Desulfovibrio sp. JC010]NDV25322.1 hypothetical protein [Desulfovibrio sp. JC010]